MLGAEFDEALLRAIASDAATADALDRLVEADLVQRAGHGRDGSATGSRTRSCTRWSTRTCSSPAAPSCTSGPAARSSAPSGPSARAAERPRGARPSLEPQRRQGARARAICWRPATGRAPSTPTTTPSATTSGRCARSPGMPRRCDDHGATRARAARRPAGAHRAPRRGAGALRGGARRSCEAAGDAPAPRACTQDRRAALGSRRPRARQRLLRGRASSSLGEDGDPIERAQLFQEMGRLAFRAGDNAGAIAWAERALAEAATRPRRRRPDERARESRRDARAGLQHARRRAGAHWAGLARRWRRSSSSVALAEAHELLQAACRGYTNLGVLYSSLDPQRSIETCLRGLETAQEGRRPRLPVAALCQPRGRLLRADRPLRGRGHRGGAHRRRPRPPARPARPPGGAADRARARSTSATATTRLPSPRTRRRWRLAEQTGEPQLLFPCYDGLATLYLDAGDAAHGRALPGEGAGRSASGPASSPTR